MRAFEGVFVKNWNDQAEKIMAERFGTDHN